MSLNWDDLKVLLAVTRSGSLTRASALLGVDQSTTSRRLTALEAALGTTLFVRSKTGIRPTELGEKLVMHALEVERRTERMAEVASSPATEPTGTVRLVGNHWVIEWIATQVLPQFLARNPRLIVRLVTTPPVVQARGDATISLWFETQPQPGEFAIKLAEVPFAMYAPKGKDPDALDWISFFDEDAPRRAPVRVLEKARKRGDVVRVTGTDARLVAATVRAGAGKGLLPMCLMQNDATVMRLSGPEPDLVRTLHLHTHPDTVQSLRVQTVIRWLREVSGALFNAGAPVEMHRPARAQNGR